MPVSIKVEQNSLVITSDEEKLATSDAEMCLKACKDSRGRHAMVVFEFSNLRSADSEALKRLIEAAELLDDHQVKLVVLAHNDFASHIEKAGFKHLIRCFIQAPPSTRAGRIDAPDLVAGDARALVGPTTDAVKHTIRTYARLELREGRPFARESAPAPKIDIAGTVGVVGARFQCVFTLGFPLQTYLNLATSAYGKAYTQLHPEILDWAAELVNVTLGQMKTSLNQKGFGIQPAIPTVVRGRELELLCARNTSSLIVPFESETGPFHAELSVATSAE